MHGYSLRLICVCVFLCKQRLCDKVAPFQIYSSR
jgi:hypothetical protein